MSLRLLLAAALVAAAVVSGPALAAGDVERGRVAASHNCVSCHGADGISQTPGVPSLAGQPADFITVQMILFREQLRMTPPMPDFARGLTDEQIEDLAAYFASLPPGPPEDRGPRNDALGQRGAELSAQRRCGVCHLPDYRGHDQIPRISRQREEYLADTLIHYRDGTRAGPDSQMNGAVVGLSDADLRALAHYLAQQN